MTERYLFFNSTANDPRIYQAEDMAIYWESFLSDGVVGNDAINTLTVLADGTTLNLTLNEGRAVIQGHLYVNDSPLRLTIASAVGTNRIDRLVIRYDNTLQNRNIRAIIKEGTATAPPSLERNSDIYEISLAQIRVTAGQSFVRQADITDERNNTDVGGFSTVLASRADANQISLPDPLKVLRSTEVESGIYENNLLGSKLSIFRSELDNRGVFRRVESRRADDTLALLTLLSNPDANGNYQTQTITVYEADGITIRSNETWNITYDLAGNVTSEVRV